MFHPVLAFALCCLAFTARSDELQECRKSLDVSWLAIEKLEAKVKDLEEALAVSEAEVSRLLASLGDQHGGLSPAGTDVLQLQAELKKTKDKVAERDRLITQMKTTLLSQREQIRKLEGRVVNSIPAQRGSAALNQPLPESAPEPPAAEKPPRVGAGPVVAPSSRKKERAAAVRTPAPPPRVEKVPAPEPVAVPPPKPPLDPVPLLEQGQDALVKGDFYKAEESYLEILGAHPDHIPAKLGLANCYFIGGASEEALAVIEEVLDQDGKNPEALGLAGLLAMQTGEYKEAVSRFEKALKYDEANAQLYNYLGMAHYAREKNGAAIKALDRSVELDPSDAEAQFNYAVVLAAEGGDERLDQSRRHYEAALRLGSSRDENLEAILYRGP